MSAKAKRPARWRNQAKHHAAELRRVACQLRRIPAPALALKIAAGRVEAIAREVERSVSSSDGRGAGQCLANDAR